MTKHPGHSPILIGSKTVPATVRLPSFSLRGVLAGPAYRLSLGGDKWGGGVLILTLFYSQAAPRLGLIGGVTTVGAVDVVENKEGEQVGMAAHLMAELWLFWRLVWPTFRRPGGYFLLGRIVV